MSRDDSWTDVFVGVRRNSKLGDHWGLTTEASVGAGGSDLSWGLQLVFARELASGNRFVTGFKALSVDYQADSVNGLRFNLDTVFAGATVGYLFD